MPESLLAMTTASKHHPGNGQGADFQCRQRESRVQKTLREEEDNG